MKSFIPWEVFCANVDKSFSRLVSGICMNAPAHELPGGGGLFYFYRKKMVHVKIFCMNSVAAAQWANFF